MNMSPIDSLNFQLAVSAAVDSFKFPVLTTPHAEAMRTMIETTELTDYFTPGLRYTDARSGVAVGVYQGITGNIAENIHLFLEGKIETKIKDPAEFIVPTFKYQHYIDTLAKVIESRTNTLGAFENSAELVAKAVTKHAGILLTQRLVARVRSLFVLEHPKKRELVWQYEEDNITSSVDRLREILTGLKLIGSQALSIGQLVEKEYYSIIRNGTEIIHFQFRSSEKSGVYDIIYDERFKKFPVFPTDLIFKRSVFDKTLSRLNPVIVSCYPIFIGILRGRYAQALLGK